MSKQEEQQKVIYPGFFDPLTMGHLNIITRAASIYEHVIVAVAQESNKKALLSLNDRLLLAQASCEHLENVEVETFSGLLMNYVHQKKCRIIVRGIRTVSDYEYEFQMSLANKHLDATVETVFMMTDAKHTFLSSTLIKEIARLGGNIQGMVPSHVERKLKGIYGYELSC